MCCWLNLVSKEHSSSRTTTNQSLKTSCLWILTTFKNHQCWGNNPKPLNLKPSVLPMSYADGLFYVCLCFKRKYFWYIQLSCKCFQQFFILLSFWRIHTYFKSPLSLSHKHTHRTHTHTHNALFLSLSLFVSLSSYNPLAHFILCCISIESPFCTMMLQLHWKMNFLMGAKNYMHTPRRWFVKDQNGERRSAIV